MGGVRVRTQSGSSLIEVCVALLILGIVFPALMLFLITVMKSNQSATGVGQANLAQSEVESFSKLGLNYSAPTTIPGGPTTTTPPGSTTTTVAPVYYLPCAADLLAKSQAQLNNEFPATGPATLELLSIKSKKLTSSPAGIGLYTTDGNNDLWVSDAGADRVVRYTLRTAPDPAAPADPTNRRIATVPVGTSPQGVTTGAGSVWVANFGSDTLSRINTSSNTVQATRGVGDGPQGLAFGASAVWVANSLADTVSRFNPNNNTVLATIPVGDDPRSVAFDGTNVWVTNFAGNSVSKISPATNTVTATVAVGEKPQGVTFGAGSVWVANSQNDYVSRIAVATNQVTATISVGDSPQGVSFDGTSVWVANFGSDNLSKITPASNSVTATVPVGIDPIFIASGTGTIGTWVPSSVGGKVTKLNSSGAIDSSDSYANVDISLGSCLTAADETGLQLWTVKVNAPGSSKVIEILKAAR
jgi:YVTN family beta-propeller protein